MTEFSRNSRSRDPYTESHTVQRSKDGPTHPYSGEQSQSASQYSGGSREEGMDGADINFQINLQYIMPLISTIKQENEHLLDQKATMQKDMSNLQKISKMLLTENQQLRKHYGARTADIKKLIETISINTHEQVQDLTHQCFLMKESNCILVKNIEGLIKEIQEKSQNNERRQGEIDQLAKRNIIVEQACRDMQVNNKQLEYRVQQAQLASNKVNLAPEDQRLNDLLVEVVALKNTNKANIRKANEEKPAIEDNLANIRNKNAELLEQASELREKVNAAEEQMNQKKTVYQQSTLNYITAMKGYERGRSALSDTQQELVLKKNAIAERGKTTRVAVDKLEKVKKEKETLRQMIFAKKEALRKKQEEKRLEEEQKQAVHLRQLKKIRDNLGQQQASANEEIVSKLSPESTMVQSSIIDSKDEFASLVQEVDDLRQALSKLSNPLKQIVRAQYQLRKRRAAKG